MTLRTTSVTISQATRDAIVRLSEARYGQRGVAARWVEEQLRALLEHRDFLILYAQAPAPDGGATKAVRLTPAAARLLESGVLRIRKLDPLSSNVQSRLLRAAFALALADAVPDPTSPPLPNEEPADAATIRMLESASPSRLAPARARKRPTGAP